MPLLGWCHSCNFVAFCEICSGVTPMGSEWANPRAPGLRGHPQDALSLWFQLRLPFQKVRCPFEHFFHCIVPRFL